MSAQKSKRNTQKFVAVNEEASAALQKLRTAQEPILRRMEKTVRSLSQSLDALQVQLADAFIALRLYPDYVQQTQIPTECPGWGQYDKQKLCCAVCPHVLDCITVQVKREEPSRDQ